jgi:hypothetical protein
MRSRFLDSSFVPIGRGVNQ